MIEKFKATLKKQEEGKEKEEKESAEIAAAAKKKIEPLGERKIKENPIPEGKEAEEMQRQ